MAWIVVGACVVINMNIGACVVPVAVRFALPPPSGAWRDDDEDDAVVNCTWNGLGGWNNSSSSRLLLLSFVSIMISALSAAWARSWGRGWIHLMVGKTRVELYSRHHDAPMLINWHVSRRADDGDEQEKKRWETSQKNSKRDECNCIEALRSRFITLRVSLSMQEKEKVPLAPRPRQWILIFFWRFESNFILISRFPNSSFRACSKMIVWKSIVLIQYNVK